MKIVKTKVQATTRKLNAKYTVEDPQSLKLMGTLSNEVYDDFAKIIQEEIDREIVLTVKADSLVKEGWIQIPFTVKISIDWFKENMQDEYAMILGKMYFKNHEDAVLYTLTWSNLETEYG
jgi:hypothetical protein